MKNSVVPSLFAVLALTSFLMPVAAQERKTEKKVIVITSDGSDKKIVTDTIIIRKGKADTLTADSTVIIRNIDRGGHNSYNYNMERRGKPGGKGEARVFIYNNEGNKEEGNDKYDVFVDSGMHQEMHEAKVRYMIAKNGLVVTIEGDNEKKAKALFDEVSAKLGEENPDKGLSSTTTSRKVRK